MTIYPKVIKITLLRPLSKHLSLVVRFHDILLTVFAKGFKIGRTSSSAIHWSTLGGPTNPPKVDDKEAIYKPKRNKTPTSEI